MMDLTTPQPPNPNPAGLVHLISDHDRLDAIETQTLCAYLEGRGWTYAWRDTRNQTHYSQGGRTISVASFQPPQQTADAITTIAAHEGRTEQEVLTDLCSMQAVTPSEPPALVQQFICATCGKPLDGYMWVKTGEAPVAKIKPCLACHWEAVAANASLAKGAEPAPCRRCMATDKAVDALYVAHRDSEGVWPKGYRAGVEHGLEMIMLASVIYERLEDSQCQP